MQLYIFRSQTALDFLGRRAVRHIDFDKNLLYGLVPGSPGCLAGDNTALLLKVHRHGAVSLRLTAKIKTQTDKQIVLTAA